MKYKSMNLFFEYCPKFPGHKFVLRLTTSSKFVRELVLYTRTNTNKWIKFYWFKY